MVELYKESGFKGRLLFSDIAYSSELVKTLGDKSNGIEGIASVPDPTTGFDMSYQVKFGEKPSLGESAVYDAVMVACYASPAQPGSRGERHVDGRFHEPHIRKHRAWGNSAIQRSFGQFGFLDRPLYLRAIGPDRQESGNSITGPLYKPVPTNAGIACLRL